MRAAGLLAQAGANVTVTSRQADGSAKLAADIKQRFGGARSTRSPCPTRRSAGAVLEGCEFLLSAGGFGVRLVPREAWAKRPDWSPPPTSTRFRRSASKASTRWTTASIATASRRYGALGIGGLKMKIHKACIAKLFERNDLVLDAESILEVARTLI